MKSNLLNLLINCSGKILIKNPNDSSAKGSDDLNINKILRKKIIIKIKRKLLIPDISGIVINTPNKAFLDVVSIIAKVKRNKSKMEIYFLQDTFLFINKSPNENGHIIESQVPA